MRVVLLDTHALLWWVDDDRRLGPAARRAIAGGEVRISIVSLWEIAVKHALGKLSIGPEPVSAALDANGFEILPITRHHCFELARLAPHHRDPFDRMLIAQARADGLTILSNDRHFARYGIDLIACAA